MVPLRDAELKGLKIVAQGELELYKQMGDTTSKIAWGAIIAGLTGLGWLAPRPQEKAKIEAALRTPPPAA